MLAVRTMDGRRHVTTVTQHEFQNTLAAIDDPAVSCVLLPGTGSRIVWIMANKVTSVEFAPAPAS